MYVGHIGGRRNAYQTYNMRREELFRIFDTDGATIKKMNFKNGTYCTGSGCA